MSTTTGYTKVINDDSGIPKGVEVETVTWDAGGAFVSKSTVGYWVVSQAAKDAQTSTIAGLESDKSALQNQVNTLTSDKAALTSQVASLQSQLTGLPAIQTQLAEALELVEEYRPFDPNQIRSAAFYARLTGDELFRLGVLATTDETAKAIMLKLSEWLGNTWEVILDDPETTQPMQYLAAVLPLTTERVAQILRPATKDEAYLAPVAP